MQAHLFSRSSTDAQATGQTDQPEKLIVIFGECEGEMDEPRHFILEAARTIKIGKAMGRTHGATALKAFGLLGAACHRAKCVQRWSTTTPDCNPLPDFVALHDLAAARLGPVRQSGHPVTTLRAFLASAISELRGLSA